MRSTFIVVFVASVFAVTWYLGDIRRLTRDYACKEPFDGPLVRCRVRFVLADYAADCALGANSEGLYISSATPAFPRKPWWAGGYVWDGVYMVRTPLFIPWNCLRPVESTLPLADYIRFDVPSLKIGAGCVCFFIPRETGELLLKSAGQQVSSRSA
jgi:hypothetical protein